MKIQRIMIAGAAVLLLAAWAPGYALQDSQEPKRPAAQPAPQEQAEPAEQPNKAQEQEREKPRPAPHGQAKPGTTEEQQKAPPPQEKSKPAPQAQQAKPEPETSPKAMPRGQQAQRAQQPARGGSVIPPDRFQKDFGPQHRFRITQRTAVGGQTRFYYASYWFVVVDPWPGWGWDDNFYIDYINDGYYLCDPLYPQVFVAVVVVAR